MIESEDRIPRISIPVAGRTMSVAVAGQGPPIVLLHGNATFSYMWRNLIPFLAHQHRCLAPDLIGMGRSDVLVPSGRSSYSLDEHSVHVDLAIELLVGAEPAVLIGHELGATMALQYARRNPDRVMGLVLLEGVFRISNDMLFAEDIRKFLLDTRSEKGDELVLRDNAIVEYWLPRLTIRSLTPAEMDTYRTPYAQAGESRRAHLSMIRQLPIRSRTGALDGTAEELRLWCAQSRIPKLVIGGDPGFLVTPSILGTASRWALTSVASVRGRHFLTEDSPTRLAALILDWMASLKHGTEGR